MPTTRPSSWVYCSCRSMGAIQSHPTQIEVPEPAIILAPGSQRRQPSGPAPILCPVRVGPADKTRPVNKSWKYETQAQQTRTRASPDKDETRPHDSRPALNPSKAKTMRDRLYFEFNPARQSRRTEVCIKGPEQEIVQAWVDLLAKLPSCRVALGRCGPDRWRSLCCPVWAVARAHPARRHRQDVRLLRARAILAKPNISCRG